MIKEFNALKGTLALMIFIHHLQLYYGGGSLAVALFFMLGGFLSVLGYKEKILRSDFSYKQYIFGKVIKFYPLHLLLLLVAAPLALHGTKQLLPQLVIMGLNASLLHAWIPIERIYFSLNMVSWYLSDTIAFVAVFPFILRWIHSAPRKQTHIVAIILVITYVILWTLIPDNYVHRFFYINPLFRILDYVGGMVAALYYLKLKDAHEINSFVNNNRNALIIMRMTCFIVLVIISCFSGRYALYSAIYMPIEAFFLILIALTGGGILSNSILQKFGDISFSFFLTHQIIIRYFKEVLDSIGCDSLYILSLTSFFTTIIVSYFLTFYFDKNISLWLKKKINQLSMTAQS